ncbi:Alpha/Beta hydrolase protein [Naematelia encephala]|uniref:Alpha/Beta hydrolase protein n=1 Tax=Naematelia encephala TaxID=71784 RepID=A0A1Y2APK0_9TREE|nr:Alpha/Beta hydrolase protein [Naematelia encephala]
MINHHVTVNGSQIYVVEHIPEVQPDLPSVILVSGLGDTSVHWCAVQRLLPRHVRSFAYDRLGLGRSDRTSLARTAAVLASELKATLDACQIPPPYLLVASSYAGIICREFLESFDDQTAGLVYVDANQERTRLERQWPDEASERIVTDAIDIDKSTGLAAAHRCTKNEWAEVVADEQRRREEKKRGVDPVSAEGSLCDSSLFALGKHRQLDRQALGKRPLSVIVANLTRDIRRLFDSGKGAGLGTPEDHALADQLCARLPAVELSLNTRVLKLSSIHRMVVTSISGHKVALWEPDLCVQEIMWCLGRWGEA